MTNPVEVKDRDAVHLDAAGFNEIRQCRTGPLIYNKNDIYVGGSLRKYGEFSWDEQVLFQQFVKPGMLVVEVGANIGAHSVELARTIGPTGCLHAFEPQRLVFQNLCANLAINQLANVFAYQMALGDTVGTILVPPMNPTAVFNNGGVSLQGVEVGEPVALSMLDMLGLPACHFIKADVEGMEVEVIKGGLNTIEKYRPLLFVENDRSERSSELLSLILELGYDIYWHLARVFNPDNYAKDAENIFPTIVSINVFCCPTERAVVVEGMRKVTNPHDTWKVT